MHLSFFVEDCYPSGYEYLRSLASSAHAFCKSVCTRVGQIIKNKTEPNMLLGSISQNSQNLLTIQKIICLI